MAHKPLDSGQPASKGSRSGSAGKKRKAFVLPEFLHAHLQSRQLISSMRLRPADGGGAQSARAAPAGAAAAAGAVGRASAPAACLGGASRTYVPYKTLPLIFKQRRQHLQQQKSRARHTEPYQQRPGEGLLALPEDVLVRGLVGPRRWLPPSCCCLAGAACAQAWPGSRLRRRRPPAGCWAHRPRAYAP